MSRWQSVTLTADEPCVTSTFPPLERKTDTLKMSSARENKSLKISYAQAQQAYTHLSMHLCKNTCMIRYIQEHTDVHAYICAYMYIQAHIYMPTSIYIYIYTNMHTNTHIHLCIYTSTYAHI